ncbi:Lsr2 family protein [Streptosporangiaceae bacterium NEAU-GS5]|nr:Lsr2 family protein [Streptosporangiaceae bacterium NEAU-GS5]
MAEKVVLIDDLDLSEGTDVVRREFPLLERTFAIDLSDDNHRRLSEALTFIGTVVERSREVKRAARPRKADPEPRLRGYTNTDVREWARAAGLEISARGKLTEEIIGKFIEAHPDATSEE